MPRGACAEDIGDDLDVNGLTKPVRAELVEALSFLLQALEREEQPFDRLRANGLRLNYDNKL